jgi:hypothetical protein
MVVSSAICVRCGELKPAALGKCVRCGFLPSSPEDQARSLMLSRQFDAGETVIGLQPQDLHTVATRIQSGEPFHFDPDVLAMVMARHGAARQITARRLLIDLVRWLWLPVAVLAGMYWLLWRT